MHIQIGHAASEGFRLWPRELDNYRLRNISDSRPRGTHGISYIAQSISTRSLH
jgi:hypothetical protein